MKKLKTVAITAYIVAAAALLGLYAVGLFDGDGILPVVGNEYATGGFVFSGGLRTGVFHGPGAVDFTDGRNYAGGFAEGRFEGEGVFTHPGGANERGWHFDGIFHDGQAGSGTFYFGETATHFERDAAALKVSGHGWRYSGGLNERGQNGEGTFIFADGSSYIGQFSQGMADGEGVLTDAAGNTVYTGGFKNGLFDGHGIYFSPEGWTYEGSFRGGLFDGEGTVTDGESVVRGIWENGVQTVRYE